VPKGLSNVHRCMLLICLWLASITLGCREGYRYPLSNENSSEIADSDHTSEVIPPQTVETEIDSNVSQWSTPKTRLLRLTTTQFLAKVENLFGQNARPTTNLPKDLVIEGSISLGTSKSVTTERDSELYATISEEVAEAVVNQTDLLEAFHPCFQERSDQFDQEVTDEESRNFWFGCLSNMTERAAQKIWGRSLNIEEWDSAYTLIGQGLGRLKIPQASFTFCLSWLLQSPHFLYRLEEVVEPNHLYTDQSLAKRLSYFLTDNPPDDTLLSATDLKTMLGWQREVERLLDSPQLETGVRAMINDLWSLWKLDQLHLNKDPDIFEHLSAQLGNSAKEETLMTIWEATDSEALFPSIFTQKRSYIDPRLAAVYEIPAPQREGFAWATIPDRSKRSGLLGQVSFLALNAHPTSTSSTLRGYFILDKLLCSPPPPPPADVDTSIPEPTPDRPTLRDRLESHLSEPSCAGCHRSMDMIGLTFEGFDGLGRERRLERGVEIDFSGELLGESVVGPQELSARLSEHPMLAKCLTKKLFRYGRAQYEEDDEIDLINKLALQVENTQFTFKSLLRAIVLSEGFHGPFIQ
jgi:hypothetical protein